MPVIRLLPFALLVASSLAGAQAPATPPPVTSQGEQLARLQFKALDVNGDGALNREEVALFPRLAASFDRADANRDGLVSYEELRSTARDVRAERQQQRDAAPADAKP